MLELFYDLVFVFTITQVSHLLVEHLTWSGAGQSLIVLLAAWWAWNYTTWTTNELDPSHVTVRVLLIVLMFFGLLMAVAIPHAFGDDALLFAGAYVAVQIIRHSFLTFAAADRGSVDRERALHILIWFAAAGVFWIAGAFADSTARVALWIIALAIDYIAPAVVYWLPGRKRLKHVVWNVSTRHFTERFHLFIILALGETIIVTGSTTSSEELNSSRVIALTFAFLSTVAFWWLYFAFAATLAEHRLEAAGDGRTAMARDAYTYLHVLMVAGIILSAVGDEFIVAHPTDPLPTAQLWPIIGGPALFLFALFLFQLRVVGTVNSKRLAGIAALLATALLASDQSAVTVSGIVVAILLGLILASERAAATYRSSQALDRR